LSHFLSMDLLQAQQECPWAVDFTTCWSWASDNYYWCNDVKWIGNRIYEVGCLMTIHHLLHDGLKFLDRSVPWFQRECILSSGIFFSCFHVTELVLWSVPTILEIFCKQGLEFNLLACAFTNELFRYFIVYYANAETSNFYCTNDINRIIWN
jgi:hypothetical protein